ERGYKRGSSLYYARLCLSLRRPLTIDNESFDALLAWLDPDREIAGQKYEVIRAGLIRIFVSKGFSDAEDLADETINGVARFIIREMIRRKEVAVEVVPVFSGETEVHSDEYDCLLKCLRFLPADKRDLILDYYVYDGRDKIAQHRRMAEELGITEGALRGRAHHIRGTLEKCIQQCILRMESNENQDLSHNE